MRPLLILLVFLLISGVVSGQDFPRRPKIGLVLSGGGAKGIAHIEVLRTLDSLGIVPDYIAGTSMGAIVGGLYAAGYRGDTLRKIVEKIDWTELLTNKVPFREINIEEKDEFGRYIAEIQLDGFKPRLPLGLVDGQKLDELLAGLTLPVWNVSRFDSLAIPFTCVAFDIYRGEAVMFHSGSLMRAMRSSMAIPSFFTPVAMDSLLLVDGGVYSNFPVSYCREMGAEFIIGSDVGGGWYGKDKLNSLPKLLAQAAMLSSNRDQRRQRRLTNIYIDHVHYLKYESADFGYAREILAAGRRATNAVLPQLQALAQALRQFPAVPRKSLPNGVSRYRLQTIRTEGMSNRTLGTAMGKFGIHEGDTVTIRQLNEAMHRLFGTRLFSKVNYSIEGSTAGDAQATELTLSAREAYQGAAKMALHYDSEAGTGIIANLTYRNLLGRGSRLLASVDIAERPRFRAHYYRFLDTKARWWIAAGGYGERDIRNSFYQGRALPDVISYYGMGFARLSYSFDTRSYAGFGIRKEYSWYKPRISPADLPPNTPLAFDKYELNNTSVFAQYQFNSLNKVYYPSQGAQLSAEARLTVDNNLLIRLYQPDSAHKWQVEERINPYLRWQVSGQKFWPLSEKVSWIGRFSSGMTFSLLRKASNLDMADGSGVGDYFNIGGQADRPRGLSVPFFGLRENELSTPQVLVLATGIQWSPRKNLHILPMVNVLAGGYDAGQFLRHLGSWDKISESGQERAFNAFGYGVTAAFTSLLGPISLTVSRTEQVDKLRLFFNVGFQF